MAKTKPIQYRSMPLRLNRLRDSTLRFFYDNSSKPRLLLEVFIRRNFGDKYFNFGSAISVAAVLFILPRLIYRFLIPSEYKMFNGSYWHFYWLWDLVAIAFSILSVIHYIKTRRNKKNLAFSRIHHGDPFPFFYKINLLGKATEKRIAVIYEPLIFFILGYLLMIKGHHIGALIFISSIFYSFGNFAGYYYTKESIEEVRHEKAQAKILKKTLVEHDIIKNTPSMDEQNNQEDDEITLAL